ncbi:hypothetical protein ACOD8S_004332 [Escherichia coli]|nr:hypothetical protein [Escherichia coli]EEX1983655.1 hypothetical protein [Escherichia coli]EFL9212124.1 hypothetical protein [Escherichia coli]EHO4878839.1 hypothetical protein [Escherichia coli]EHY9875686.1 hypothetical protein [Escherichia coli]
MRTAESPNSNIAVRPVNPNVHISMTARKAERAHICELLRDLIETAKQTHTTPLETCSAIERLIAMLTNPDELKGHA